MRFNCPYQILAYILFCEVSIWMHQLNQSRNRLTYRLRITLLHLCAKCEILVDGICIGHFPLRMKELTEEIGAKAEMISEV